MITSTDLVTAFPEFSNSDMFPAETIDFWIGVAYKQLSPTRFGESLDLVVMLWVAHNISLAARDVATAEAGGAPGAPINNQTSKSVGSVSVSYEVASTSLSNGGYWNATSYGRRLLTMVRGFTAGGVYRAGNAFARMRVGRWG